VVEGGHQLGFPGDQVGEDVLHRPDALHAGPQHFILCQPFNGGEEPGPRRADLIQQCFLAHRTLLSVAAQAKRLVIHSMESAPPQARTVAWTILPRPAASKNCHKGM